MGGVTDGQTVNAAITNAAFLYKNGNDSSSSVYTLLAPTSGPQINDVQNTVNVILFGVGGTQSTPATAYSPVPSNTVTQGVSLNAALVQIAGKFYGVSASGGHNHTGTAGDGASISIAASGQSAIHGDATLSASGAITLTQSGQNIQIYAPASGSAVNTIAASGSSGLSGAVVLAPSGAIVVGQSGQAIDIYAPVSVNTIAASGSSGLSGAVVLAASGSAVITQSGQNITIYAPAASGGGGSAAAISVLTKTAGYTVQKTDFSTSYTLLLECNAASAATFTLPAASTVSGYELFAINIGTAVATISTNGTDTFGSTSDTTWTLVPGGSPQASNVFVSNGSSRWDGF
jgi:hypothetical protein